MRSFEEQRILSDLAPHIYPLVHQITVPGWRDLMDLYEQAPLLQTRVTRTTRAGMVHDFQVDRAAQYAAKTNGVELVNLTRLMLLIVEGQYAIRWKKLDDGYRSRNIFTGQVESFLRQEQLPGIPLMCNLELGYQLDRSERSISGVFLACPSGRFSNFWQVDLLRSSTYQQVVTPLFPPVEFVDEIEPPIVSREGEVAERPEPHES